MKIGATLIFFLAFSLGVFAQGIDFFHGTWQEALEAAKKQDRIIFVDAYAVWCGPCKRMANDVFTNERVGEFYNANFVNVKLDMERGEGLEFRKKYPVSAFPTLFYIDYNGEVVTQMRGAQDVNGFINLGQQALGKIDRSKGYAAEYEKGSRDPELMINYVRALNKAGKPSNKIANDYLRSQKDLTTEQNLRFIQVAAAEADSRAFDLLIEHRAKIAALTSEDAVNEQIKSACEKTVVKAAEFQNRELLAEAQMKMKKHYPAAAELFFAKSEMDYAMAQRDAKTYTAAVKEYLKKTDKNRIAEQYRLANTIASTFRDDHKAMKVAEDLAHDAAKDGGTYEHYFAYANILFMNEKNNEALKAANKALELAKAKNPSAVRMVESLIERIQG